MVGSYAEIKLFWCLKVHYLNRKEVLPFTKAVLLCYALSIEYAIQLFIRTGINRKLQSRVIKAITSIVTQRPRKKGNLSENRGS